MAPGSKLQRSGFLRAGVEVNAERQQGPEHLSARLNIRHAAAKPTASRHWSRHGHRAILMTWHCPVRVRALVEEDRINRPRPSSEDFAREVRHARLLQ